MFIQELVTVFFIGDCQDYHIAGDNTVIGPEVAAPQSIEGWFNSLMPAKRMADLLCIVIL
jgi:hypothetical protein